MSNDMNYFEIGTPDPEASKAFYGDVHAAIERARQLGATVVTPVIDNGMIQFAHLADPLGNRFGIWQRKDAQ